jgi:hypothetical protein
LNEIEITNEFFDPGRDASIEVGADLNHGFIPTLWTLEQNRYQGQSIILKNSSSASDFASVK